MKANEINDILKKHDINDEKLAKALEEVLNDFIRHRDTVKVINRELGNKFR